MKFFSKNAKIRLEDNFVHDKMKALKRSGRKIHLQNI